MRMRIRLLFILWVPLGLAGCDLSQIPGMDQRLSFDDSKAIGAACRHAGRALEDCFVLNPKGHQAGVFQGWREMNDYMLANKIEVVKPELPLDVPAKNNESSAKAGKADKSESDASGTEHAESTTGVRQRWVPPGGKSNSESPEADSEGASGAVSEAKAQNTSEKAPAMPRPWERPSQKSSDV